ncbi:hypothetical protein WCE37_07350 [Luteimonas sp. MJ250]|uniref:hypothetical protein n=1 Tax=Luteimonas sp. MJ250 TaxID=3129236 RepID=UPI0031BA3B57
MLAAALLVAGLALAGCDRDQPGADAIRFTAGERPADAALADDIARGLSTDARVLDCEQGLVNGRSAFTPDWVRAHRLDLDDDGREDWVVEGRHRCLAGPDGADWWLYAEGDAGRRLLLAAGSEHALEVLPSRSHGFRDLRLLDAGGRATSMRYDGEAYAPAAPSAPLP